MAEKLVIRTLLILAAASSLAMADGSAQDACKMVQRDFAETARQGVKLSGYVDFGYSYNFTGGGSGTSDVSGRFASDTAARGDFNLYAAKFTLERGLAPENRAQAGFRVDVMIGEDATYLANRNAVANTRNYEQNSSALLLEQAYVSLRAPVGNGWDFQIGKFVSILGFEVIERPANLNITYGLLWEQMPLYYTRGFVLLPVRRVFGRPTGGREWIQHGQQHHNRAGRGCLCGVGGLEFDRTWWQRLLES